jgi:hypothetical protein
VLLGARLLTLGGTALAGCPGPEVFPLDELVRCALAAHYDPRHVIADRHGRYFGTEIAGRSLVGDAGAQLGVTRFEDWLAQSKSAA